MAVIADDGFPQDVVKMFVLIECVLHHAVGIGYAVGERFCPASAADRACQQAVTFNEWDESCGAVVVCHDGAVSFCAVLDISDKFHGTFVCLEGVPHFLPVGLECFSEFVGMAMVDVLLVEYGLREHGHVEQEVGVLVFQCVTFGDERLLPFPVVAPLLLGHECKVGRDVLFLMLEKALERFGCHVRQAQHLQDLSFFPEDDDVVVAVCAVGVGNGFGGLFDMLQCSGVACVRLSQCEVAEYRRSHGVVGGVESDSLLK